MSKVQEELQFQIDQLTFRVEEQNKQHAEAIARLKAEARQIRKGLLATLERGRAKAAEPPGPGDDSFIRQVRWRIDKFSEIKATPKGEAIWSEEFSVLGVPGMQLEFFPQGRESTRIPGFCALFLWCPGGVKIRYRLCVGKHWSGPDEDEFDSRMGHGHSNICLLEPQKDESGDSVTVGLEIQSLHYRQTAELGMQLCNRGPEAMVERELAVLRHVHMNCVEWRIKKIAERMRDVPRGTAIWSPTFSIAGVREMLLEFYPNGIQPPPGAKEGRPGYCGFYVRASSGRARGGPLSLQLTLFVGGAKKGPIRTDFDGVAAKGVPEFCQLQEQLDGEDLLVGVEVVNPKLEEKVGDLIL